MTCPAELTAALASAKEQLDALSAGDEERFLGGVEHHRAVCSALVRTPLGADDRPALEALMALNRQIVKAMDQAQDERRRQMARSRSGVRMATAYLH